MNVRPIGDAQALDPIKTLETIIIGINYTMNVDTGVSFAVTSEMWIVPRKNYFFMIGVGMSQNDTSDTKKIIREIINSIEIE